MFHDLEGFRDIRVMGRAWKMVGWSKQTNSVVQEEHKQQGGIAFEEETQERKDLRADHHRLEVKSKPWYHMISGLAIRRHLKKMLFQGVSSQACNGGYPTLWFKIISTSGLSILLEGIPQDGIP